MKQLKITTSASAVITLDGLDVDNVIREISSFPKEQQVFMKKYTSSDKITLIKLLAERDANSVEIIESFEKQGQKSTWSEEDEEAIEMAIIALEDMYDEDEPNITYGGYNLPFNKAAERLKSLRQRHTWKPSKEQMDALKTSFLYWRGTTKEVPCAERLESPYEQLKQF